MGKKYFLFFIFCCCLQFIKFTNAACTISTNQDISNPQVLLLRPEGGNGNDAFFMPDQDDVVNLSQGQVLNLNCGTRNFRIDGVNTGSVRANATCMDGNLFSVLGSNIPFNAISCGLYPVHTPRLTGNTCLGNYQEFEIGFEVDDRFITLITGCFDPTLQTTIYSVFELLPNVVGYQVGFASPTWTEGDFYSLGDNDLNTLYTRNTQRVTINHLLGLEESSTKYVHGTNNFYLARGHLSAKTDFIYGNQQRATFQFLNAAPQWQMVNQANWATLEANVRSYVINSGRRFVLYTGTYGVSTLPHEQTGENVELYLYVDGNNNKAIPVPQLYWKILYDLTTQSSVVFLLVNNPYYLDINRDVICTNVCDQISWLTWAATNVTRGYSYCCTVDDFRSATGISLNIQVSGLLT